MSDLTPEQRADLRTKLRRLRAVLPLVEPSRHDAIRFRVQQLERQLGEYQAKPNPHLLRHSLRPGAGIRGVGGLAFTAQAPPGQGRLQIVPMYPALTGNVAAVITNNGGAAPSTTSPVFIVQPAAGVGVPTAVSGITLQTGVISWAKLRVVGLKVWYRAVGSSNTVFGDANNTPITGPRPSVLLRNLSVGGGANLLMQDEFIDADVFSALVPELAGIRAYPLLQSPNQATVQVAVTALNQAFNSTRVGSVTMSVSLVCDVIEDGSYGNPIPGPYDRLGAMARDPNPEQAFVP